MPQTTYKHFDELPTEFWYKRGCLKIGASFQDYVKPYELTYEIVSVDKYNHRIEVRRTHMRLMPPEFWRERDEL